MNEGEHGLVHRIVDGVESVAERALDAVEDTVERALGHPEREHSSRRTTHRHEREGVNVTVNIDCCDCQPDIARPPGDGGKTGHRPGHVTGTSDGSIGTGITTPGDVIGIVTRPPDVWPGTRTQLYLPFLLIRANPADTGVRPLAGVFWESPDILILPGVSPAAAPPVPPELGGVAQAGADNTVYAHVWNLGQAPVADVLVEFYWFDPSLGFDGKEARLIGATWIDLAQRASTGCHRLVKCPESWPASYVNGGHECLVVRASHRTMDPLTGPEWDASKNRHIGQRNIHVMTAAEAAAKPTIGIAVGPLFGGAGTVEVARADTGTMPWLHLVTMDRNQTFGNAAPTGDVGITVPTPVGAGIPVLGGVPDPRAAGLIGDQHGVTDDGQQVAVHATDGDPGAGKAHVYRVTGTQDGSVFGGYTVVVTGS